MDSEREAEPVTHGEFIRRMIEAGEPPAVAERLATISEQTGSCGDVGGKLIRVFPTKLRGRGFWSMPSDKRRQIAGMGGKAAQAKGTAHKFTSQEARAAGRAGGQSVAEDREHMSRIGKAGGNAKAAKEKRAK